MVIVTEQFSKLAATIARSRGKPSLPILVIPSNVEELSDQDLRALASATLQRAAEALTTEG